MDTVDLNQPKIPFGLLVIVGPSGAGKTTLMQELLRVYSGMSRIVTYKTRKKRDGERHMEDYYFCDEEEFFVLKERGFFAETECVHGDWSGTPLHEVSDLRASLKIISVDIHGALNLKARYKPVHIFFVQTTSMSVLEQRLKKRGQNDPASLALRLHNAQKEINTARTSGQVDLFLVNDDFAEMVARARAYIDTAMCA